MCPVGMARTVNESVTGFPQTAPTPASCWRKGRGEITAGTASTFVPGSHCASAQRSPGLTRVMQGISGRAFAESLMPGESFETPEAVMAFSEAGFNGLPISAHDFVNAHIVPRAWRYRSQPALQTTGRAACSPFDESRLLDLAGEQKLGCELFVLDDGWSGGRNSDRAGLGDYNVNEKAPSGIDGWQKDRAHGP